MLCISLGLVAGLYGEYKACIGYTIDSTGVIYEVTPYDYYYTVGVKYAIDGTVMSSNITYGDSDNIPHIGDNISISINPDNWDIRESTNDNYIKTLMIICSISATVGLGIVAVNIRELI